MLRQLNVPQGVLSPTAYYRSPVCGSPSSDYDHRPDRRAAENRRICPNMTRCRERVYAIAPLDARLYRLAQQLEKRTLAQDGGVAGSR